MCLQKACHNSLTVDRLQQITARQQMIAANSKKSTELPLSPNHDPKILHDLTMTNLTIFKQRSKRVILHDNHLQENTLGNNKMGPER